MASKNPLIRAVKDPMIDVIENARTKIPANLNGAVTSISAFLPTTVAGVSSAFTRTYTDVTVRMATWLPSTVPALTGLLNKLMDKLVAGIRAA